MPDALPAWDPTPTEVAAVDAAALDVTAARPADALAPALLSAPGGVTEAKYWGAPNQRYVYATDPGALIARTVAVATDMDVVGWSRNGAVYGRLTDDGRAIALSHFGEGASPELRLFVGDGVLHRGQARVEAGERVLAGAGLRDEIGGEGLQLGEDLVDLLHVVRRDRQDAQAVPRADLDEALRLEEEGRLADRRARDA